MRLYLMRHGDYVVSAPDQPLSSSGADDVRRVLEFLKKTGAAVSEIWHSPKLRAVQTAEIAREFFPDTLMNQRDDLTPNASASEVFDDIERLENNILLVSHLPFIPNLLLRMIPHRQQTAVLQAASVVIVEKADNEWKITDVITPGKIH
ncbi:MAG: phosphohistidine phosphatase SixA [Candidatus Omnitrophota bacterium]